MPPAAAEQTVDAWLPARLIPTGGIKGQQEQEARATSALLAVLKAVPEFAQAVLKPVGAPKGQMSTYVEVPLKDADGKVHRPDGAIVIERGKTRWSCLVEVKTGDAELTSEQVTRYIDVGKRHGFDAVLTISSAITSSVDDLPMTIHGTKLRAMPVKHLSWWRIITEAVVQERYRGISDPDQAWILSELIAYLDHESSGAGGFKDMGANWVTARDAAHHGTLRSADAAAKDLCREFDRFTDYLSLGLEQDLGVEVAVVRPRKSTADERHAAALTRVIDDGCLGASIRIEDTAGDLELRADLRTKRVSTCCTVKAPEETKPLTRIKWLIRQLDEAPADLRVEVGFKSTSETTSMLLGEARVDPEKLLSPTDPRREPKAFVLELTRPLGAKRGKLKGSFVGDTKAQVGEFYRVVLQHLAAWQPKAPKLREAPAAATLAASSAPSADPPPFIDGPRDAGEGRELSDLEKYNLRVKELEAQERAD